MRVTVVVVGWIFGGAVCHSNSKGVELSYKLGYLIMAALLCPVFPIFPVCPVCPICPVFPVCPVRPYRQGLSVLAMINLHRAHYELPIL